MFLFDEEDMKNTKLFFGLVLVAIYSVCNACEDGNANTPSLDVAPQEVIIFSQPNQNILLAQALENLHIECYKNDNAQACRSLLAFSEQARFSDVMLFSNLLMWNNMEQLKIIMNARKEEMSEAMKERSKIKRDIK